MEETDQDHLSITGQVREIEKDQGHPSGIGPILKLDHEYGTAIVTLIVIIERRKSYNHQRIEKVPEKILNIIMTMMITTHQVIVINQPRKRRNIKNENLEIIPQLTLNQTEPRASIKTSHHQIRLSMSTL